MGHLISNLPYGGAHRALPIHIASSDFDHLKVFLSGLRHL